MQLMPFSLPQLHRQQHIHYSQQRLLAIPFCASLICRIWLGSTTSIGSVSSSEVSSQPQCNHKRMQHLPVMGHAQVAVDLIAERSAGGMVEMFYCTLPDVGEAFIPSSTGSS